MKAFRKKEARELLAGIGFLAPNILGFLTFILGPLLFSLVLAASNWNLELHNRFHQEPVKWVFLDNFYRLVAEPDFRRYLGNTLFLMMGIPFSIAGSLLAAVLLTQKLGEENRVVWIRLLAGAGLLAGSVLLVLLGLGASAMTLLLGGLAALMLLVGVAGGSTAYRLFFYTPHFTAGVATFLLWQKMYSPYTGPINHALRGPLAHLEAAVRAVPDWCVSGWTYALSILLAAVALWGLNWLRRSWSEGEMGSGSILLSALFILLPVGLLPTWSPLGLFSAGISGLVAAALFGGAATMFAGGRAHQCAPSTGIGTAMMSGLFLMVLEFVLLGIGNVFHHLPSLAAHGLAPPKWLADYHWAKPAIMIMALWASIGSNNMLLYLAGLSNIPLELYEAAEIDGASRTQKFWYITWPQLAPVTFFIVVMSMIGGLQGGFEMARTMTGGGPAGATTFLSYYVYQEGFEWGRIGFASAISWMLFMLVFLVTLFNWQFGNRYVND